MPDCKGIKRTREKSNFFHDLILLLFKFNYPRICHLLLKQHMVKHIHNCRNIPEFQPSDILFIDLLHVLPVLFREHYLLYACTFGCKYLFLLMLMLVSKLKKLLPIKVGRVA